MKQPNIQHLMTKDGHSFYYINHDYKKVICICNNKMTKPVYDEVLPLIPEMNKLSKNRWNAIENEFYATNNFEWMYEKNWYQTFGERYAKDAWPEDLPPNEGSDGYEFLCFHNGQIWSALFGGNYMPQVCLNRTDISGKKITKWTNVRNIRNFRKMGPYSKSKTK